MNSEKPAKWTDEHNIDAGLLTQYYHMCVTAVSKFHF